LVDAHAATDGSLVIADQREEADNCAGTSFSIGRLGLDGVLASPWRISVPDRADVALDEANLYLARTDLWGQSLTVSRFDLNGAPTWPSPYSDTAISCHSFRDFLQIGPDGLGGVWLTWDAGSNVGTSLWLQHLDPTGQPTLR
jgi:hypothetical protein